MDNMQIVLDEMGKEFIEKFAAFVYEDICKDIFSNLCKVDHQNKRIFAKECKYHAKLVDASVYFAMKEFERFTKEYFDKFIKEHIINSLYTNS